ncbi:hypothetical protein AX769_02145 [Frondihabitans sp. PAMC 28766]|nr:hypothetical protein AX769_02145 [Frondihabitans sp. PAMC 28766]
MGSRRARALRGLGVAVISVVTAALSHVIAGGAAPGGLGTGLALVFAILACTALAGRRLSTPRLIIAVALSQLVFHVLFSLGAAIPEAHGHSVTMLGMVMSGGNTAHLPALTTPRGVSALEVAGARMWLGHAVAAVATIVLLLHGERALAVLLRVAAERLAVLVSVVAALPSALALPRGRRLLALGDRRGVPSLDVLLSTRPHRGPPSPAL